MYATLTNSDTMHDDAVDYNLILILAFWPVLFFIMKKVAGTSKEA